MMVYKIDALPAIVRQVNGRCEVFVDGGITQGTDILKAIALGAKMVRDVIIYYLLLVTAQEKMDLSVK